MASPNETLRDLVSSPEFGQQLKDHLRTLRENREAFLRSATFQKMQAALLANPAEVGFSNEEAAYFPEEVKTRLEWEFATKDDIDAFVRAVGNPLAATVAPGTLHEDPESSFGACTFEHFGMYVSMVFGQGTSVYICNRKADAPAQ